MKKNIIIKLVLILIVIGLVAWGVYELINNMAFSFATMLIVALLAVVLLYLFYRQNGPQYETVGRETGDKNLDRRKGFSVLVVGCFGLLAIFAMSNYFYPSKEVFSNNDHHAIAVEGIETRQPSLLLAADSRDAFFDDHTMAGSIELTDISTNDSTATLRIRGAGMPIYRIESVKHGLFKSTNYYTVLDGQDNIHSWSPEESLELLNENRETVATLRVEYSRKRERLHKNWKGDFILDYVGNDGNHHIDTSSYHGIIRRCYSLSSLFPGVGVLHGVDFSKIELLRPKARLTNSNEDDDALVKMPFLLGYNAGSGLWAVRSGNAPTQVGASSNIAVNLDESSYAIGIFNNIPDFRLAVDTTGLVAVRYRMPLYRSLNTEGYKKGEDDYYTFMIASTLLDEDGEINGQIPQNILLYDVFYHNDNRFQMKPVFISFRCGKTSDTLGLKVLDVERGLDIKVNSGQRLPDIATSNDRQTHWVVSLENFRDSSLQRPKGVAKPWWSDVYLMGFVLLMTVLCCVSLMVGKGYYNYNTYIEPIAYVILLALLAVRLTLLWRASVFPPTSGISLAEFNVWRTSGGVFTQIAILCVLLILIVFINKIRGLKIIPDSWLKWQVKENRPKWLNKILRCLNPNLSFWMRKANAGKPEFIRKKDTKTLHGLLWPQDKAHRILFGFAGYLVVLLLGFVLRTPFWNIGLPVIWYFVMDIHINIQVGSRWSDKGNDSYAFFWQGIINSLLAFAVIFVLDGGYGLLFFVFSMLMLILRLIDLYGSDGSIQDRRHGVIIWGVLSLSLLIVVGVVSLRGIVIGLFTKGIGFSLSIGLCAALFVAVLIWTVGGWRKQYDQETGKERCPFITVKILFVVCAVLLTIGAGWWLQRPKVAHSHIANRIMVLADDPSKVLGQAATPLDMTRFLEASLNDWVLEEYEQRGNDVKALMGEQGQGFFKMQPHSNVGVSWMTQLTDLSVSRFIIAEQAPIIPILLILLFLVMEVAALFFPTDRRWAKSLLVQIPLLLTVQSLLVWMAVTRRFVFLGQDFPMISLISRVNLYISILGLLVWILTAIVESVCMAYEQANYRKFDIDKDDIDGMVERNTKKGRMYHFVYYVFGWVSTIALLIALVCIFKIQPQRHFEKHTYDVSDCIRATRNLVVDPDHNSIEYLFREYQEDLLRQSDISHYDITRIGTPSQILNGFCASLGYSPEDRNNDDNIINRIFMQDADYGIFAKAAFDDFLKNKINQNDTDELIYIVKRRFVDPDHYKVENVRYTFGITLRYFHQQLPKRIDKSWRGSITAIPSTIDNTIRKVTEGNVDVYTIPASWTKDQRPAIIVKPHVGHYSVVGRYEPRHLDRGECYYLSEGEVLTGRNVPNLAKYGNGNYLAKNVFINSHPQFIYPLQSVFYWSRPLAEQISSYMDGKLDATTKKSQFEEIRATNSTVTISIEMTKNLVQAINRETTQGNVAVVVADGEGRVKALVDHKSPRYLINPNDAHRIQFVEDSLKREGMLNRGHEAEQFFGNKAILSLNFGPGSSQKPIVWTAVTTQYRGWDWNQLQMARINNELMHKEKKNNKDYYCAWSFAGQRIDPDENVNEVNMFRSLKGDEGSGDVNVNVRSYMRKSSNYYNAIMVYLGSHTRAELEAGLPRNNPLLVSRDASWLDRRNRVDYYCDTLFPLINYNGRIYSFARPLSEDDVLEPNAMLPRGLSENFGLPVSYENNRRSDLHKSMQIVKKEEIKNYFAFPEQSYFNTLGRLGSSRRMPNEITREGIKSTAIGQKTVWLVSPLKMAEMYGKLISFNSNYRLTIDPDIEKLPYQAFGTDGRESDYLRMRNQQFIPGLADVFTASGGTASDVYGKIRNNLDRDYFIYGKTGTIDGKIKGRDEDDHLLAVIITNKDIATLNEVDDYQDLRFYVIYIADFDYSHDGFGWKNTDAAVINTVLQSEEFKRYMEEGE